MLRELLTERGRRCTWVWGILLALLVACRLPPGEPGADMATVHAPTPGPDRLAEPILPAEPTQYEQGRHLYWLHCMPCHGDRGQGLTDEFRALWEEDHQNCWARGCHAGRAGDEGFPLPRTIPAVIAAPSQSDYYASPQAVFEYLQATHPPQRPGALRDDEYWAVSDFLLRENGFLAPGQEIGPQASGFAPGAIYGIAAAGAVLLITSMLLVWFRKRRQT